jgi:hypothetical protein
MDDERFSGVKTQGQTSSRPSFQHNLRSILAGFFLLTGFWAGFVGVEVEVDVDVDAETGFLINSMGLTGSGVVLIVGAGVSVGCFAGVGSLG